MAASFGVKLLGEVSEERLDEVSHLAGDIVQWLILATSF